MEENEEDGQIERRVRASEREEKERIKERDEIEVSDKRKCSKTLYCRLETI
jgi:hypothetical protein